LLDLVFDTETTGKIDYGVSPLHHVQPGLVQLGAILYDNRKIVAEMNVITIPITEGADPFEMVRISIPPEVTEIHGIDDAKVDRAGITTATALLMFMDLAENADRLIAYNAEFDLNIMKTALYRADRGSDLFDPDCLYCAMLSASNHLKIPGRRPGQWAWPKLQDAYKALVDPKGFDGAHDAMADVRAAAAVVWALEDAGAEIVKI